MEGALKCWGANHSGQVIWSEPFDQRLTPVTVFNSGVTHVVTSFGFYGHTCALVNGEMKCWGNNSHGQLGDATLGSSRVPASAVSSGVRDFALGTDSTCAVLQSGDLKCWGNNELGLVSPEDLYLQTTPNLNVVGIGPPSN